MSSSNPDRYTLADRWCTALGAVLLERNGLNPANNYEFEYTEEIDAEHRHALKRDWGIASKGELMSNLQDLQQGGHNASFLNIRSFLSTLSVSDQNQYIASMPNSTQEYRQHRIVQAYMNRLPSVGIAAWDWGRYVYLCKNSVFLGYISREEAEELVMPIAKMTQQCYSSWHEYGISYLIGRQFWWGQITADSAEQMTRYVHRLVIHPDSPWNQLDWNTPLEG
ncbi:DUF1266 domain-containing protein [Paenibacillus bouchesdurhonensis]|uniref:DUF1266 domain-containing protein n=1 Tax=Paenibacillus bouchesdurhonensis TaxID=1870990 RepID=UPI001F1E92DB|nr:DUF1266 domain-containing protein [Paenibacillus bouchesdurhonensis]